MAKWQSYKRFCIVDTISREYVDTIDEREGCYAKIPSPHDEHRHL